MGKPRCTKCGGATTREILRGARAAKIFFTEHRFTSEGNEVEAIACDECGYIELYRRF